MSRLLLLTALLGCADCRSAADAPAPAPPAAAAAPAPAASIPDTTVKVAGDTARTP